MFDKEGKTGGKVIAGEQERGTQAGVSDVVIHVMPKDFYGKEASLLDAAPKPEAKPLPPPPPVIPPPPAVPVAPTPQPVNARPRSRKSIVAILVFCLLLLGVGGYGAYRLVSVAREQRAAAQAEVERLQREAEEKAAAEEAARRQAAEDAANAPPTPAKDTDSDGLTDVEELLYGTNFRDPDTDKDSYLDGNEVFHRYHPLGDAPSTLIDTGAVKVYENTSYPFTVYYPSTWSATLQDESAVVFRSSRQATMRIAWSTKGEEISLLDWLRQQDTDVTEKELKETLTKEGYYGYITDDDRTAYLNVGTAVVTMTYDLGGKTQIEYLQTFQMMVNSFTLLEVIAEEDVEDTTSSTDVVPTTP